MTKSKTIAMPISSFLPSLGGMEVGLHNIASKLIERGYAPLVIAPATHVKALKEKGWDLPYEVISFPPKIWSILQRSTKLGFVISNVFFSWIEKKYNVAFWHCTMGYPVGCAITNFGLKRNRKNYLIRCAGEDIQRDEEIGYGLRLNPKINKVVETLLPKAPNLIAISNSVKEEYKKIGANDNQIHFVPNGVDLRRFEGEVDREQVRVKHGLPKNTFLFISVGRNHPKKNYESLLKSLPKLKQTSKKLFHLCIVGKGVKELLPLCRKLGMEQQVTLLEEIGSKQNASIPELPAKELIELYKAADAFVFPSLIETFGIAIVEAMAAGLPVIVGDSPGCRDIVENGKHGVMVLPKDYDVIMASMNEILSSSKQQKELAKKSLKRAKEFSWDSVTDKYIKIYNA